MDFDNRKPFKPEATDLHGPGVEFWRNEGEENHYDRTDEAALRARVEVRSQFIGAAADFVRKLTGAPLGQKR